MFDASFKLTSTSSILCNLPRKFKYSLTREQGKLTEIQARLHQGWSMDSKTPQRYYHKDLDNNPEQTKDAVNKFLN